MRAPLEYRQLPRRGCQQYQPPHALLAKQQCRSPSRERQKQQSPPKARSRRERCEGRPRFGREFSWKCFNSDFLSLTEDISNQSTSKNGRFVNVLAHTIQPGTTRRLRR